MGGKLKWVSTKHHKKNHIFKKPNGEVLIKMQAFLAHSAPAEKEKESIEAELKLRGLVLWARGLGTAFHPSLLRSRSKITYACVGQLT